MLRPLLALCLATGLAACASAPPQAGPPSDPTLVERAERHWRERLAAHLANGNSDEPNALMAQAPLERLRDPIADERERRLLAASCRLTLDHTTGVIKVGEHPIFFPSADLDDALAEGLLRPALVNPMPSDTLGGVLVGLDVDDARETLWLVPCEAPHTPKRHLHIEGADFARAAIHPSGTSLIVPRGELFELPLAIDGARRLRLASPPCDAPTWHAELWTPDGLVSQLTCGEQTRRVVLAPSPAGWFPTPYLEVTALVRDIQPTRGPAARAPTPLLLGLRGDPRGLFFRSLDHGDTWEPLTIENDLAPPSAEDIVVSPRLIAVRTAHADDNPLGGQVFVSTNRKTFARARSPFGNDPVDRLWLSEHGTLLAGRQTIDGALSPPTWLVVESRDLGRTWQDTTATPPPRPTTLTLPDGGTLEPGPRGLWKRRLHGSRALVFPR